ncbi:MAG: amidase [Brevibacterium sp.]
MTAYAELELTELAAAIRAAGLSPSEALAEHLARIDAVNPAINAVVTRVDEAAWERARAADSQLVAARAEGRELPPLFGVPLTHKDSIPTAGIRTTFGSPLFKDNVPTASAVLIDRSQRAGVNTTGKTNVPEFAAGSHTFNPLFGTTRNPYDLTTSAGGSSGGAAAAIAAGIQPVGDGSDTGGSLRTPGSFCNLIGYRPSHGRIPVVSSLNPWTWMSRQGFLARTVADIRLLMSTVAGPHPAVPGSLPRDDSYDNPAASALQDLNGIRVGWSTDLGLGLPVERRVLDVIAAHTQTFTDLGCEVEDAVPDLSDAEEVFQTTRAFDFATAYAGLIDAHRDEIKDAMVWNADKGTALTFEDFRSANAARARLEGSLRDFFATHDVLITPAVQVAPFDADIEFPTEVAGVPTPNYLDWMRAATTISATGLPCLSVPAGFTPEGLPVGLQLVIAASNDALLLRIAEAFALATGYAQKRPVI